MKKKFIFAIVGLLIFVVCFISSIRIRDYFYEKNLRENIHKVKVGMTEKEVVEILGEPTLKQMSDGPVYWCYETDTIGQILDDNPTRMGKMLVEMTYWKNSQKLELGQGYVTKVFDFDH
jgi:hypothetical protein